MARPYSSDLRARVVEAVDEGATRHEAAERFGISVASAVRWHQAWRNEGTIEAKPCGGSRSALFRFLVRHGITFKKSPARQRAGTGGRGARPPALDTRATAA